MAGLLSSLAGCGGGTTPPPIDTSAEADVAGVVTVNGKPFNGSGYYLILAPESGSAALVALGSKGEFTGRAKVGALVAGVLPERDAQAAHGDNSKIPNPLPVTIDAAGSKELKIDLSAPPPALPKPVPGSSGSSHSG